MRLIQYELDNGERAVGKVDGENVHQVNKVGSTRDLALQSVEAGKSLAEMVESLGVGAEVVYQDLLQRKKVLPPLDHPDPAHCMIVGTGLTHVASAAARDKMHTDLNATEEESLSPSMQMFKWGLEGGKSANGTAGVQPEWFYKGDGSSVVRPGGEFPVPAFADDEGEEPEVVGLYVIGPDQKPYRVGYAIGNEATDHVMEKKNYLYLAHSKLRYSSFGPELYVGDLPDHVEGQVRIVRNGEVVWEKPFATGESNMSHSLDNLEYHHFKYNQFLRPGDVHVHFMGTSVASFGDGVQTQVGDRFEIEIPAFGKPLINGTRQAKTDLSFGAISSL